MKQDRQNEQYDELITEKTISTLVLMLSILRNFSFNFDSNDSLESSKHVSVCSFETVILLTSDPSSHTFY